MSASTTQKVLAAARTKTALKVERSVRKPLRAPVKSAWVEVPASPSWPGVRLKGWVLTLHPSEHATVVIRTQRDEMEVQLTERRPDVAKQFGLDDDGSVCGWQVQVPIQDAVGRVEVEARVGGEVVSLWEIEFSGSATVAESHAAWSALIDWNESIPALRTAEPDGSANLAASVIASNTEAFAVTDMPARLDAEQRALLRDFANAFESADENLRLIASCVDESGPEFGVAWQGQRFAICASVTCGDANFVVLRAGRLSAVLFQYSWSGIALCIPEWGAIVSWSPWLPFLRDHYGMFLREWFANFRRIPRDAPGTVRRCVWVIGNARPYHFFYDQLAPLLAVARGERVPKTYVLPEHGFLVPPLGDAEACAPRQLNERVWGDGSVAFMVGADTRRLPIRIRRDMLRAVRAWVADEGQASRLEEFREARACFPVVWVGISSQKRVWVEQEDGLVFVLNAIARTFPGAGVVFDGWTSPLEPGPGDRRETQGDEAVVDRIRARLAPSIRIWSVVGRRSLEKIAVAALADFYITNWLQGGLHIDGIAHRPGVAHFNRQWRAYEGFYEYNHCVRVSDDDVQDVGEGRPDMISYSIHPQTMWKYVSDFLANTPLGEFREISHREDA